MQVQEAWQKVWQKGMEGREWQCHAMPGRAGGRHGGGGVWQAAVSPDESRLRW